MSLNIVCLVVSACGGGGTDSPSQSVAPAPPSSPPPSPPPPGSTSFRPNVYVEQNASDGVKYIRVEEPAFDPFQQAAAQRVIADQTFGPGPGANNVIGGPGTTQIRNVDVVEMKHGFTLQGSGTVHIYDYTYTQFAGGGSIFGAGIKLGDNGAPTNGDTYIQRVVADGMQAPDGTYKVSNNDFIGVEEDSDSIFIRDVTGGNFGDAGVDTKSTRVYLMNATLSGGHRMLRAWPGVEIVVVNSIINSSPGHTQGWVYDGTAKISYYNTLWCQDASSLSASDAACSRTPLAVEGEDMSFTDASARFVQLQSNPLPQVNAFFQTRIDQIIVEASRDNGGSWQVVSLPNTGSAGVPPVGDTRYRIPIDLNSGNYIFRASYRLNGAPVGQHSLTVSENGTVGS